MPHRACLLAKYRRLKSLWNLKMSAKLSGAHNVLSASARSRKNWAWARAQQKFLSALKLCHQQLSYLRLSKYFMLHHICASCFNERKLQILSESIDGPETETYVSEPIVILPKAMGICHISLLSREKKILLCFHKKYASLFVLTRNKSTYPLKPKLNRKRPTVDLSKAVEKFLCFPEKKNPSFVFTRNFSF